MSGDGGSFSFTNNIESGANVGEVNQAQTIDKSQTQETNVAGDVHGGISNSQAVGAIESLSDAPQIQEVLADLPADRQEEAQARLAALENALRAIEPQSEAVERATDELVNSAAGFGKSLYAVAMSSNMNLPQAGLALLKSVTKKFSGEDDAEG